MSWEIKLINYPVGAKYWSATFGVDYFTEGLLPVEESWVAPWSLGGQRTANLTISLLDAFYGNYMSSSGNVSLRDGGKYTFDWSLARISDQNGRATLDWKPFAVIGAVLASLAFMTRKHRRR